MFVVHTSAAPTTKSASATAAHQILPLLERILNLVNAWAEETDRISMTFTPRKISRFFQDEYRAAAQLTTGELKISRCARRPAGFGRRGTCVVFRGSD
jgi:hypothetical protein